MGQVMDPADRGQGALMALVDAEYIFGWVDIGTEWSCSDAQIFNISQLRGTIDDGSIGFSEAQPQHHQHLSPGEDTLFGSGHGSSRQRTGGPDGPGRC